jgi:transposase
MKPFIGGEERSQIRLPPEWLDDYIADDNPVPVVDVFVDELKLHKLGFEGAGPAATGRPSYHPAVLLTMATSTRCSRADAWSAKRSATSSCCG